MAIKKEDLILEAEKLGIELSGNEKFNELKEAVKIKKEELGKAPDSNTDKKKNTKKVYFYHLKVTCYVDETRRAEEGLYMTNEENARLNNLVGEYVEVFEGEVPTHELHKIAEKFRVSIYEKDGKKTRDEAEILADLVKEL